MMNQHEQNQRPLSIFYAAGPGDIVRTFSCWRSGTDDPDQVGVTYSSLFFDVCRALGAKGTAVSSCARPARMSNGQLVAENLPKPRQASGWRYHLQQLVYVWKIARRAARAKADMLIMADATGHFFPLRWFLPVRMAIVPSLHCTLWPESRRLSPITRLVSKLDGRLFSNRTMGILCHPNDIHRQVLEVTEGKAVKVETFMPYYRRALFEGIAEPPETVPFRLLFAGRLETEKGIDDLLAIAVRLKAARRRDIEIHLCGGGSQEGRLRAAAKATGITSIFRLHGHCRREEMRRHIGNSHAFIVPTRTTFEEGFNQVVVESVLAGRPVITSSVCPALDFVKAAAIEVPPDDTDAYYAALIRLVADPELYREKRRNCRELQEQFYEYANSWGGALHRLIEQMEPRGAHFRG